MADDTTRALSESDVYALLAERRRRLIVRILDDFSTPLPVDEIARLVGNCEYDEPAAEQLEVVAVSLYHAHLPRLEAADVIAYDRDAGSVSPGPTFGVLVGNLMDPGESDGTV